MLKKYVLGGKNVRNHNDRTSTDGQKDYNYCRKIK